MVMNVSLNGVPRYRSFSAYTCSIYTDSYQHLFPRIENDIIIMLKRWIWALSSSFMTRFRFIMLFFEWFFPLYIGSNIPHPYYLRSFLLETQHHVIIQCKRENWSTSCKSYLWPVSCLLTILWSSQKQLKIRRSPQSPLQLQAQTRSCIMVLLDSNVLQILHPRRSMRTVFSGFAVARNSSLRLV